MLSLDKFDLGDIAMALQDQTDYEHFHLVNPLTGEMGYWTEYGGIDGENPVDLDELDLIAISPLPSYVWYQDMVDFAEGISDERAGRRLARALDGRGAFRHFRNELHDEYPELLSAWHKFSDIRANRRAVEWLADNALIDRDAADRFFVEHPDPDLPCVKFKARLAQDVPASSTFAGVRRGACPSVPRTPKPLHFER